MANLVIKQTTNNKMNKHISILSWNILAQCYFKPTQSLRFQLTYQHLGENNPLWEWDYRKKVILNQILESKKDIICLQEVEFTAYKNDLLPFLTQHGFNGSIQHIKNEKHPQGVATFWRSNIFENVGEFSRNRTLTTILKDEKERLLAVINCHLEGNPQKSGERTKQICSSIFHLNKHYKHHAVIVSGDFNCQNGASTSSAYLSLGYIPLLNTNYNDDGKPSKSLPPNAAIIQQLPESTKSLPVHIISVKDDYCLVNDNQWINAKNIQVPFQEWNNSINVTKLSKIIPHPYIESQFKSVYPPVSYNMLSQNIYSLGEQFTFATRPGNAIDGLDQMWYTSSCLNLETTRPLYTDEIRMKILSEGLPHMCNPSDHIPIGATFSWKNELKDLRNDDLNGNNNNKNNMKNNSDDSTNKMNEAEILKLANELYDNIPLNENDKEEFYNIVVQLIDNGGKGRKISKDEIEMNKTLSLRKKDIMSNTTPECKQMLNRFITLRKKAAKQRKKEQKKKMAADQADRRALQLKYKKEQEKEK